MVPYARCRFCKRHRDEVGKISRRGRCLDCGVLRSEVNARELHEHQGESYERWIAGMTRYVQSLPRLPR